MGEFIKADAMHLALPIVDKVNAFEWWYFDAHLDNGDHVVVMLSTNDTRLSPRKPSVRLNIYEPNGNAINEILVSDDTELAVSYDKCDTVIGENYCRDCGGYFELNTIINGNGVHLEFYASKPYWTRPASTFVMGWTVSVPTGTVKGYITKDNKKTEVSGSGYHDHNWGTKPMGFLFKNWYWGKVHTEDYTIDYGIMIPRFPSPIHATALLVVDKDGAVLEPTVIASLLAQSKLKNKYYEPELGFNIPKQIVISANQKGCKLKLVIDMQRLVMKEKSDISDGESAYRYVAKECLTVTRNGESKVYNTSSLHEIVYLLKSKQ